MCKSTRQKTRLFFVYCSIFVSVSNDKLSELNTYHESSTAWQKEILRGQNKYFDQQAITTYVEFDIHFFKIMDYLVKGIKHEI